MQCNRKTASEIFFHLPAERNCSGYWCFSRLKSIWINRTSFVSILPPCSKHLLKFCQRIKPKRCLSWSNKQKKRVQEDEGKIRSLAFSYSLRLLSSTLFACSSNALYEHRQQLRRFRYVFAVTLERTEVVSIYNYDDKTRSLPTVWLLSQICTMVDDSLLDNSIVRTDFSRTTLFLGSCLLQSWVILCPVNLALGRSSFRRWRLRQSQHYDSSSRSRYLLESNS